MLTELPKPQTSVSVVRLLVCASLVEPIEVATADLVEFGSADQAHGSPHALFERAEGATACREHDLGGHVGGRMQAVGGYSGAPQFLSEVECEHHLGEFALAVGARAAVAAAL